MPFPENATADGIVVLASGGLDSTAALFISAQGGRKVVAVTADYGQPAFEREREAVAAAASELGCEHLVVDLRWMKDLVPAALDAGEATDEAVWVPNRNGLLVNVGAAIAEARGLGTVAAGFNRDEAGAFPDNSDAFVDAANHALEFSTGGRVRLSAPTGAMTKREIVQLLLRLGGEPSGLWSCYGAGPGHCGECPSCRRLFGALAEAEVEESRWPLRKT